MSSLGHPTTRKIAGTEPSRELPIMMEGLDHKQNKERQMEICLEKRTLRRYLVIVSFSRRILWKTVRLDSTKRNETNKQNQSE